MKKLILVIVLVVSLGACNSAPTDYVTQADLDNAISQCISRQDLNDYVVTTDLDNYVNINKIDFLQKQIYMNRNSILLNNTNKTIELLRLKDKVTILEYKTR